ncbi:hypothetical protein Tco_1397143 [Tanacetum coccineum]
MLHQNRLNLPCRKAHLLEDKQILSVGVFDEHLDSFWRKYTWLELHLGRKSDKISTLHEIGYQKGIHIVETASQFLATTLEGSSEGVRNFGDSVRSSRLKEALEDRRGDGVAINK